MSYDIAIWKAGLTRAQAKRAYAALPGAKLVATPAIAKAYRAITASYPELDDDTDDDERSPWSARLDLTPSHILAPMSYARAVDVPGAVAAIVKPFGLVVFDPQTGDFVAPRRVPKPRPHDPGAILAGRLARPLAKHGFALAPYQLFDGMPVFARRAGIATQELTFRPMTTRHVDAWLRIQLDPIAAELDPITAGWKRGLFGGGWHGGAVANDLFALSLGVLGGDGPLIGDHDISPGGIARTVRQVVLQCAKYALPIFAQLSTVARLDRFLHGKPFAIQDCSHTGYCEQALVGAIVTRLAKRRDRARWIAAYHKLISRRDALEPPHLRAARAAFTALA